MTTVDICIITYQRPKGLEQLLQSLDKLTFTKCPQPDLQIIVVDNDSEGSTAKLCDHLATQIRWPLRCFIEPRRGIPQARNAALYQTRPDVQFVAFADDDEMVEPQWLDELLRVQRETGADIVTGPVLPRFMEQPPDWVLKGRFYQRRRFEDTQRVEEARTGNVLIVRHVLDTIGMFDERLALTGGEDSLFFWRAVRAGFCIHWADNAIVHEWQPPSRVKVSWVLQRAFRTAYTKIYLDQLTQPLPLVRLKLLLLGLVRIGAGGFLVMPYGVASLVYGRHMIIKPLRIIYRGAGMIAAAFGKRYEEYRHVHRV
ncbi:MAG: glycosyltransferase [Desulfurococcaceae archaeon]